MSIDSHANGMPRQLLEALIRGDEQLWGSAETQDDFEHLLRRITEVSDPFERVRQLVAFCRGGDVLAGDRLGEPKPRTALVRRAGAMIEVARRECPPEPDCQAWLEALALIYSTRFGDKPIELESAERAWNLARELAEPWLCATSLANFGKAQGRSRQFEAAAQTFGETADRCRELRDGDRTRDPAVIREVIAWRWRLNYFRRGGDPGAVQAEVASLLDLAFTLCEVYPQTVSLTADAARLIFTARGDTGAMEALANRLAETAATVADGMSRGLLDLRSVIVRRQLATFRSETTREIRLLRETVNGAKSLLPTTAFTLIANQLVLAKRLSDVGETPKASEVLDCVDLTLVDPDVSTFRHGYRWAQATVAAAINPTDGAEILLAAPEDVLNGMPGPYEKGRAAYDVAVWSVPGDARVPGAMKGVDAFFAKQALTQGKARTILAHAVWRRRAIESREVSADCCAEVIDGCTKIADADFGPDTGTWRARARTELALAWMIKADYHRAVSEASAALLSLDDATSRLSAADRGVATRLRLPTYADIFRVAVECDAADLAVMVAQSLRRDDALVLLAADLPAEKRDQLGDLVASVKVDSGDEAGLSELPDDDDEASADTRRWDRYAQARRRTTALDPALAMLDLGARRAAQLQLADLNAGGGLLILVPLGNRLGAIWRSPAGAHGLELLAPGAVDRIQEIEAAGHWRSTDRGRGAARQVLASLQDVAAVLPARFLRELDKMPSRAADVGAPTVHVSPVGCLWRFPWAALPLPSGRPLVDKAAVALTPAAWAGAREASAPRRAAVLGLYWTTGDEALKSSESEKKALLESTYSGDVYLVERPTPDVGFVLKGDHRFGVLAASLHGVDGTGLDQGWLMRGERQATKEVVTAADMLLNEWRLPDLVVAGSCHVGGVAHAGSAHPSGLALAALGAGSSCFIGGLWDIDTDATARQLTTFWGALRNTGDPVRALRQAQMDERKELGAARWNNWPGEVARWACLAAVVRG